MREVEIEMILAIDPAPMLIKSCRSRKSELLVMLEIIRANYWRDLAFVDGGHSGKDTNPTAD